MTSRFLSKEVADRAIRGITGALPEKLKWAVSRAIAEDRTFAENRGHSLISMLAGPCGINGLRAVGEYGEFMGSPSDAVIFFRYVRDGSWAAATNAVLQEFFDRHADGPAYYVDVGANIGMTLLPTARRQNVRCIAIEPEPDNFHNLLSNVRTSCPHDNVTVLQKAAFEERSLLTFELSDANLGDHRIRRANGAAVAAKEGEDGRRVITVEGLPLDDMVPEFTSPLAVKIDTQGAEPFVVGGAKRVLSLADLLIIEFAPYLMKRMGSDPRRVIDALRKNFVKARIASAEDESTSSDRPIEEVCEELESILSDADPSPDHYYDVIARK